MIQKIVILVPGEDPIEYVLDKGQDADWLELSPKDVVQAFMTEAMEQEGMGENGYVPFVIHELRSDGSTQMHPFVLELGAFKEGHPDAIQSRPGPEPRTLN